MTCEPSPTPHVRRIPLWPMLVVAALLFGLIFFWLIWRETLLEQRAVARLQVLPGVRIDPVSFIRLKREFEHKWLAPLNKLYPGSAPVFAVQLDRPLPPSARDDLAAIRHLRSFQASGRGFTDADLAAITGCDTLTNLVLMDTSVTDGGLAVVTRFPRLRRIQLTGTPIRGPALATLSSLPLFEMSLGRTLIDDTSLAYLTKMKSLDRLDLYATPITDAGGVTLARIRNLRVLSLDRTAIGNPTLIALGKKQQLWNTLSLRYTRIDSAGLNVANVLAFQFLLAGTAIGDEAAPFLANWGTIHRLDLSDTRFTDAGLEQLRAMDGLRNLRLRNLPVTDRGVLRLLHPDPAVLAALDTPEQRRDALATLRFSDQPPHVWLFADNLRGTHVTQSLLDALAWERQRQRSNSRFPRPW